MKQPPAPKTVTAATPVEPTPRPPLQVTMRVSEKGGLSVYGLQRMPITLYGEQWITISNIMPQILDFIEAHKAQMSWKDGAK